MYREFRAFINKGNFVDIAVAFVMGAAFGAVTTAFTDRIVSPLVGLIVRVPSLADWLTFGEPDPQTGVRPGSVGAFVEALLNFVIIAFAMFLVVKVYNRFRETDEPSGPPEDITLLREIRDELRGSRA